ncbi:MAG: hypothetical protein GX640_19260 [Fibrobacter sp.]|nr:hypothetical protein [Fibrobacter sp.]
MNKGIGRIRFEYHKDNSTRTVIISDDGRGIDTDALVEKCIQKGIVSSEMVADMTQQEKLMLMFHSGISTAESVTDISGRGIGMNVVMENIKSRNENLNIESCIGKGTTFVLKFPVK